MKKSHVVWIALLALMLVLAIGVAACGGDEEETTTTAGESTETTAAEAGGLNPTGPAAEAADEAVAAVTKSDAIETPRDHQGRRPAGRLRHRFPAHGVLRR